jgi:hypothetical protein
VGSEYKQSNVIAILIAAISAFTLLCTGCSTPLAIATFSASAEQALDHGPALFKDLYGTCARARLYQQPVQPLFKGSQPASGQEIQACLQFRAEGDALITDSDAFSKYFSALHELAEFNASAISGPATGAATQAAATANLTTSQIQAMGKLASLITQAATEHFQRVRLMHLLEQADPSVQDAVQAFQTVARDYEGLLDEERRRMRARYQDASVGVSTPLLLLLDRAFQEEAAGIETRRNAAEAYIKALREVAEGHQLLALNAKKVSPKELGMALEPYTSNLRQLVPQIQKAFP